jgi:hypothetical protein
LHRILLSKNDVVLSTVNENHQAGFGWMLSASLGCSIFFRLILINASNAVIAEAGTSLHISDFRQMTSKIKVGNSSALHALGARYKFGTIEGQKEWLSGS